MITGVLIMQLSSCHVTFGKLLGRQVLHKQKGWKDRGRCMAHPTGANSIAVSGLRFRRALVGIGWSFSPTGLIETVLSLVGLLFSTIEGFSQAEWSVAGQGCCWLVNTCWWLVVDTVTNFNKIAARALALSWETKCNAWCNWKYGVLGDP